MKVLHIVKTAVGAGWAYEQARELRSLGIDIVVALPSDTEGFAPRYRESGMTVVRADLDLPASQPWRLPGTLRACRELVAKVRPDLIHTHHVGTTFVVRLALGKNSSIPRVFGVTGTLHLEHDLFAWLDTHLAGERDYWIATCRWTQKKYGDLGISPERVFLAYLGTDIRRYTNARTGTLRNELRVAPDVPLVGMVSLLYTPKWFLGRERGHKGHEDFIAALRLARETRPDIRGVIIGGSWDDAGWYDDRLRYLATKTCNGYLSFLGTSANITTLYPDLDLAVVPSLSDGLAYSVVEPLLSGVPVVATNVGGLPDLILENKTGWLVASRQPEALARAILEALGNRAEAKRRTDVGQMLARDLVDVERTGREVVAIYEKVLALTSQEAAPTSTHGSRTAAHA